jgi:hypothetical protein
MRSAAAKHPFPQFSGPRFTIPPFAIYFLFF